MAIGRRGRAVQLRDGRRARLRPIEPEDRPRLAEGFERLSADTRYRRFFSHLDALSPEMLTSLTELDHVDHEAIIAIDPASGDALGVARYMRRDDDPVAAEIAFVVADDWQGRGLGRALLNQLTKRARQEGVHRFVALVMSENRQAIELLRGADTIAHRRVGTDTEIVIELPAKRGIGAQLARVLRAAAAQAAARPWRSIGTVVVGSDGSPTAAVALDAAADLAAAFGADLHIVHAYRSPAQRADAVAALTETERSIPRPRLAVQVHARQGDPAAVLTAVAQEHDADVIVVGSKGMNGPARVLGSVPNSVSHGAPCSVLIVCTV